MISLKAKNHIYVCLLIKILLNRIMMIISSKIRCEVCVADHLSKIQVLHPWCMHLHLAFHVFWGALLIVLKNVFKWLSLLYLQNHWRCSKHSSKQFEGIGFISTLLWILNHNSESKIHKNGCYGGKNALYNVYKL